MAFLFSEYLQITRKGNLAKTWGPKSGTPVLALHGLLDNAGTYDALVPYITSNVYLVCLEFCGRLVIIILYCKHFLYISL